MAFAARRLTALATLVVGLLAVGVATGVAAPNPPQNIPMGALPSSCQQSPLSAACEDAVVTYLDDARKDMGLSPYYLPPDFASRSPDRQVLVLSNLDRIAYGLPAVAGLNAALDASASEGVDDDSDPWPPDELVPGGQLFGWTSNWAGGFANILAAYYGWMYDDGYGSPNGDCRAPGERGCWGHRQDVLKSFAPEADGFVSMGAAAGADGGGWASYAQVLVFTEEAATYYYTWANALAEGAGEAPSESEPPPSEHEAEPPPKHELEPPPKHEPEPQPPGGQRESETPAPGGQKEPEAATPSESGKSSGSTACTSACSTSGSPACPSPCPGPSPTAPSASLAIAPFSDVGATQIAASLAEQLTPRGTTARVAVLIRRGGYAFAFSSPTAGLAAIAWYAAAHARKRAVAASAVRRLIAAGKVSFTAAGTATITVRLTAQGRHLLAHEKRLKLTAVGTFSPNGAVPVTAAKSFTLAG